MPVKAVVPVETSIFRGDHCVLEVGRYPVEPDEGVPLVIWLPVYPGLHPPLDVHSGERRIYPTNAHEAESEQRPPDKHGCEAPSKQTPDDALAPWFFGSRAFH
jgi:hypothetical protein